MDCDFGDTLDLCSEPGCICSVVTFEERPGLEAQPPHTPNHDILKVHRTIFIRDVVNIVAFAKYSLEVARVTISDLEAEKEPMPGCFCCRKVVSLPCWYCSECTGEIPHSFSKISPCSREPFV